MTSEYGVIALFRSDDRSLVWIDKYRERVGRAAVAGDRLLVPADDGHLLVYERRI